MDLVRAKKHLSSKQTNPGNNNRSAGPVGTANAFEAKDSLSFGSEPHFGAKQPSLLSKALQVGTLSFTLLASGFTQPQNTRAQAQNKQNGKPVAAKAFQSKGPEPETVGQGSTAPGGVISANPAQGTILMESAAKPPKPTTILVDDTQAETNRVPETDPVTHSSTGFLVFANNSNLSFQVHANGKQIISPPSDFSKFQLKSTINNPFTQQQETYDLGLSGTDMSFGRSSSSSSASLSFKTLDGHIIPGGPGASTQLNIAQGAFNITQGKKKRFYNQALSVPVQGGEGVVGFLRATQQVPYMPTNKELFPRFYYNGSDATIHKNQPVSKEDAYNKFLNFIQNKVDPTQLQKLTDLYNSDVAKKVFSNKDGSVNYNLLASMLSLSGSGFDFVIDHLMQMHPDGTPLYNVVIDSTLLDRPAFAFNYNNGHKEIRISPEIQGDALQALSSVLTHESLHSDTNVSIEEEYMANLVQMNVYLKQLVRDPQAAKLMFQERTFLVRNINIDILQFFNSGFYGFPNPGIEEPVHPVDRPNRTLPSASNVPQQFASWKDYLNQNYADLKLPDIETIGNPLLQQCMSVLLKKSVQNQNFNATGVKMLDGAGYFSNSELQTLVRDIFELTPETQQTQAENIQIEAALQGQQSFEDDRMLKY